MNTPQESIQVVSINMGGPGHAQSRRAAGKRIIRERNPNIVLIQEIPGHRLKTWKVSSFPPGYTFIANSGQAGIACNDTFFLEEKEVGIINNDIKKDIIHRYQLTFDPKFNDRLMGALLRHQDSGVRFLIVSWHGPNTGVSYEERTRILKELIKLVTALSLEYTVAVGDVILGGDFNLPSGKVNPALQELCEEAHAAFKSNSVVTIKNLCFVLLNRPWTLMCNDYTSIDYFLCCGSITPNNGDLSSVLLDKVKGLDHNPVQASFLV